MHSGQVSLDEGCQVRKAVVVRQGRLGEAAIVMRVELWKCKLGGGWSHGTVAAPYSRLVEVLVDGITTLSAVVLLVLRLDAQEVGVSSPYRRIACRSGCGMYVAKQAESGNERAERETSEHCECLAQRVSLVLRSHITEESGGREKAA